MPNRHAKKEMTRRERGKVRCDIFAVSKKEMKDSEGMSEVRYETDEQQRQMMGARLEINIVFC